MNDIKNICVYSASSTKIDSIYFEAAEELGKILSKLSDPNSRGWVMDEAEKRNSAGFYRWLDRDLCLDSDLSSFLLA